MQVKEWSGQGMVSYGREPVKPVKLRTAFDQEQETRE